MSEDEIRRESGKISDLFEKIPREFLAETRALERELLRQAVNLLDELEYTNEKPPRVKVNSANIRRVVQITERVKGLAIGPKFTEALNKWMGGLDGSARQSLELFRRLIGEQVATPQASRELLTVLKGDIYQGITNTGLSYNVIQPLKQELLSGVGGRGTRADLSAILNRFLVSTPEQLSFLQNHFSQNAFDNFSTANRAFMESVAEETGIEFYRYSGGTVKDTREFCRKRVGNYYHKKEIEAWGRITQWQGRNRATTPATIFALLGGYNCMHQILPVSVTSVPSEVLQRNINNGNWKPSPEEREALGL